MGLLDGRRILVTGGAGGIGRVMVPRLQQEGAAVAALDILDPPDAPSAVREAAAYYCADLNTDEAARDQIAQVAAGLHGLSDVILLAGRVHSAPLLDQDSHHAQDVFETNVHVTLRTARAAVAWWRENRVPGNLVFVGSWVQDVPWPGVAPYAASKAAVRSLARSFAREFATTDIRANVLAPGIVGAGMAKVQWDTEPDYRRRAARAIPLGYLQPPESVADAAVFLCSSLSRYMTGATLTVDGGASLYPLDPEESE